MKIGISTYAYFWQCSDQLNQPLTVLEMLKKAKNLGVQVFQICDYPPIEHMSIDELKEILKYATNHNIDLELGTKGLHPEHLRKYLQLAKILHVKLLRTMINDKTYTPPLEQAYEWIREVLPEFETNKVTIALETYEQVKSNDLVKLIQLVDSPFVGICLDPANCIAGLETPDQVIENVVPYTTNLHVKDFQFIRRDGWVGFSLIGCPLGEGQLKFDEMIKALKKNNRDPNAIIELWLPLQETIEETTKIEMHWIEKSFLTLKNKLATYK